MNLVKITPDKLLELSRMRINTINKMIAEDDLAYWQQKRLLKESTRIGRRINRIEQHYKGE